MRLLGIIMGSALTAMFLFMIWRLIGSFLPGKKDSDRDKKTKNPGE